jgi:hypothetical protein
MNFHSTASHDAFCRSPGFGLPNSGPDGEINRLPPYGTARIGLSPNASGRNWFRRASSGLRLGVLLTFGSASAAIAPASANTAEAGRRPDAGDQTIEIGRGPTAPAPLVLSSGCTTDDATAKVLIEVHLPVIELVTAAPAPLVIEAALRPPVPAAVRSDRPAGVVPSSASVDDLPETGRDQRPTRDAQEFLDFDGMRVPRWIVETILRASDVTGVDPVYMMALADKESSFLPENKASSSSAEGLFQFISSTWLHMVKTFGPKHGLSEEAAAIQTVDGQLSIADEAMRERILDLRRDPFLSALMAAEMMKRDRATMERRIGRAITRSEFYLAHFFGVDSASKFVSLLDDKPKQSAERVFPRAAKANKALFFAGNGRKIRHLTVAEVYKKIDGMIDKRLDRYEDVTMITTAGANL